MKSDELTTLNDSNKQPQILNQCIKSISTQEVNRECHRIPTPTRDRLWDEPWTAPVTDVQLIVTFTGYEKIHSVAVGEHIYNKP